MPTRWEDRFEVMGTEAHVVVLDGERPLLDRARSRLRDLEQRWSRFLPDSELSRLNRRPGVPVVVSGETYSLLEDAVSAWEQTGGRFDPTVGRALIAAGYDRPLSALAEPDRSPAPAPAPTHADDPMGGPGPGGVVFHPYLSAVEVPDGVTLDLGGIAKGAAADLVAAELIDGGAQGCCVNIGGDVRVVGASPEPGGWRIMLDCPGADDRRLVAIADGAVCTTTKLQRRWQTAAGPEHHLRDPATGSGLETGLASIIVIGARATQCEVLTKAGFAAGSAEGSAMIERLGGSGLMVDDGGRIIPFGRFDRFEVGPMPVAQPRSRSESGH